MCHFQTDDTENSKFSSVIMLLRADSSFWHLRLKWLKNITLLNTQNIISMCLFGLRRVHIPNQSCTFYKLYIKLCLLRTSFIEFEWRKVFEKFYANRTSNNKNINKVHDLPGHPSYVGILP